MTAQVIPLSSTNTTTDNLFTRTTVSQQAEDLTKAAIAIKGLNFSYNPGAAPSLQGVNLAIPAKQVTALIGPSGSGKSTLLRTFNRIFDLHPGQQANGEIIIDRQNILASHIDLNSLRAKVGMVFQKPTPFPMSIFQNVAFAMKLHEKLSRKATEERVEEVLKEVALWDEVKDKLHYPATALSGGQQQRLCIARTIATRPAILLLDEPTSSLDPASTQKIESLILRLRSHYTIIIVTHNLNQARRVSDRTIFMKEGEIIEYAPTSRLFTNPGRPETLDYIQNG
jgi:phosphate transport system ATP-binding protein